MRASVRDFSVRLLDLSREIAVVDGVEQISSTHVQEALGRLLAGRGPPWYVRAAGIVGGVLLGVGSSGIVALLQTPSDGILLVSAPSLVLGTLLSAYSAMR
jgi:hypothetical protein